MNLTITGQLKITFASRHEPAQNTSITRLAQEKSPAKVRFETESIRGRCAMSTWPGPKSTAVWAHLLRASDPRLHSGETYPQVNPLSSACESDLLALY